MGKVDMEYANLKVYGRKSQTSKKNLLADILNETADAVNFDMKYLREDFSEGKGYLIEEEDIELLEKMAEAAKSSDGKRIRCKDFSIEFADTVEFFKNAFLTLARHNGVSEDIIYKQEFKINARTNFVVLRRDMRMLAEAYAEDVERYFFAPNDFMPDEDDQLTASDKFLFLIFLFQNMELEQKTVRGIYWCFVEERQGKENQSIMNFLHSMKTEEKTEYLEKVKHQALFECKLHEDEEYTETLSDMARIEGGGGKLQDRKKRLLLALKMCEIMDRNADGYMSTEEYAYGEPDFKKPHKADEDINGELANSKALLNNAIRFYKDFEAYRKEHPYTKDDERLIEIMYQSRFDENMF